MKGRRPNLIATAAFPILLVALLADSGDVRGGTTVTIPVGVGDKISGGHQIGTITVTPATDGSTPPNGGITGSFNVTQTDQSGNTLTLAQLESSLGQDHFNWLQLVTGINPPLPTEPAQFVDPPKGGLLGPGNFWADDRPWYWNEYVPNEQQLGTKTYNSDYFLNNQISPDQTQLLYQDFPHGLPPGTTITFATFLVSIYSDGSYTPLAGFTWSSTVAPDGHSTVTPPVENDNFTSPDAKLVSDQFGNQLHVSAPAPASLIMMSLGMAGVAALRWR